MGIKPFAMKKNMLENNNKIWKQEITLDKIKRGGENAREWKASYKWHSWKL